MDIFKRIEEDHGKHRGLLGGVSETTGDSSERRRLFEELKTEVEAHAAAEEQTFYAELISHADGQEKARHSISEHKTASDLIEELSQTDMSSGGWLLKFKSLREDLEHHMAEEEKEVFAKAKKLISDKRANELTEEFDRRKKAEM